MIKKILLVFLVLAFVGYFIVAKMLSAPGSDSEFVDFNVIEGQGVNEISRNLHEAGLLRSKLAFETYLWSQGLEGRLLAGSYRISRGNSMMELTRILTAGVEPRDTSVTLIEGWNNREYREYLVSKGFSGDEFDRLSQNVSQWEDEYDFLKQIPNGYDTEGYLYPDTYAVAADGRLEPVFRKMFSNFETKVTDDIVSGIEAQGLTLYEGLTLASIVEKEIHGSLDRARVAGIFYNRLEEGIGLQSDATINYITESGRTRSTFDDLQIDSPYNTYKYRGLPPGPISNPSIESIRAVAFPEDHDYFYFLTDPDGNPYYGRTLDEHNENRVKYL